MSKAYKVNKLVLLNSFYINHERNIKMFILPLHSVLVSHIRISPAHQSSVRVRVFVFVSSVQCAVE